MAAELIDNETAYTEGYLDATEELLQEMRRRQLRKWKRKQEREARRRYFMEQKFYGVVLLAVGILSVWKMDYDITFAVVMIPLGLVLLLSRKMLISNDYYYQQMEKEEEEAEWL